MDLVFVHGWGFGPDIWSPLAKKLNTYNHSFVNLDFINGFDPTPPIPEHPIVIGHSLGVLWAIKHIPDMAGLVSIAGFTRFGNQTAVKAMQRRLKSDPYGQMTDFWAACESPLTYPQKRLNPQKLGDGLRWLMDWDEEHHVFHCPVKAIAATNDAIVHKDVTGAICNDVNWSTSGGHALPLTQTDMCAESIEGFLHELGSQGDHSP